MSDDNIISMLVSQTLRPADSSELPQTDSIFNTRRELSKLPAKTWSGDFVCPQIARFHSGEHIIDIPVTFGVAQFFEGVGGVITADEDRDFFSAVRPLFEQEVNAVYLTKGLDGVPWMVFWDASAESHVRSELERIFGASTVDSVAA